jgi:sigma-54 dependent transcriptional regulator, acetoin dehydrogenase operon transcriptional activator AcoR
LRSTLLPQGPGPQPFFNTPAQRTALARERFFESGERPSGLVSEAVLQSWGRCLAARQSPRYAVAFEAVTRARMHATMERSQALLRASGDDISQLESALAGTGASVLLTDAQGVIVHATAHERLADSPLIRVAGRVGVDLSEGQLGTNAPAVVVKTQQAVTVHGAEHFFERVHPLHCAAAPIRDSQGRLAGVLDLTVEARPFAFDAAALVGVYATMIENRLLQATASGCLVLQFQVCSSMLGTPLEALVGINDRGHLAWCNCDSAEAAGTGQPNRDSLGPSHRGLVRCHAVAIAGRDPGGHSLCAAPAQRLDGVDARASASSAGKRAGPAQPTTDRPATATATAGDGRRARTDADCHRHGAHRHDAEPNDGRCD